MTTPFEYFRTPIVLRQNVNGSYVGGLWQDGSYASLSVDLITGNTINLTLNGTPLAPVPFTTSSANTLLLLQAEILLQPNILSVSLTGTGSRTITIVPVIPNLSVINSFTVTGGASQPTVTIVNSPLIVPITVSIQPLTGEEMEMLPEARREREVYKMFTSFRVNTVGTENPDQVQFFNKVYEVYEVKPWQNNSHFNIINHYCYYVMRLQPLAP